LGVCVVGGVFDGVVFDVGDVVWYVDDDVWVSEV